MSDKKENTTHFGFETILEKDKSEKVQGVLVCKSFQNMMS